MSKSKDTITSGEGPELKETPCSHEFFWYGTDTCRCNKCGKVVPDETADKHDNGEIDI